VPTHRMKETESVVSLYKFPKVIFQCSKFYSQNLISLITKVHENFNLFPELKYTLISRGSIWLKVSRQLLTNDLFL
jgi:hypothetical protein